MSSCRYEEYVEEGDLAQSEAANSAIGAKRDVAGYMLHMARDMTQKKQDAKNYWLYVHSSC